MLQISGTKPVPGVLFGITHEPDGAIILREPRILKVGIGLPRGRALNVWIHNDNRWYFRIGLKDEKGKLKFEVPVKQGFATRAEAERFYRENYSKADVCTYPRKLGFFTFTRPVISEDGTEVFEPDWDAIEAHGPTPTEIDIVFLDDNPFAGAYQMWSTSELKCKGDGINAMRVLAMAATEEEKRLAEEAKNAGDKFFPIINGCWTQGCPYSKESGDKPSPCKPGGDLKFQLARNIRVGGTAYFHTSGYRSISHIFSSLERIKTLTAGRLAGIPLKMVLRPYKTKHNGQAATQYGVSLEFRAEDIESLRKNLMEQAFRFRQVLDAPPRRLLESSAEPAIEDDEDEIPVSAQAMADEFYPDEEEEAPKPASTAAAATGAKTSALADKLKEESTRKKKPAPEPEPATQQSVAAQVQQQTQPQVQTQPAKTHTAGPADGDLF